MTKLIALYKKPADVEAFDRHYFEKHVPLAKKLPGLRRYEVNADAIASPQGESAYHLIATLHFDSMAAVQAAFASPEGKAAAGDLANFGQAGVELMFFDSKDV